MGKKLTRAEFLAKSAVAHGDRYDYSETVYLTFPQKISIRCLEHGVFMQLAAEHMKGAGCSKCAKAKSLPHAQQAARKWDTESLRGEVSKLHPSLDFSRFEHVTSGRTIVICPKHGEMLRTSYQMLQAASGCMKCGQEAMPVRLSRQHHIARFLVAHGDKYDYSLVPESFRADDKIQIICRVHGAFWQTATAHGAGKGCLKCRPAAITKAKLKGAAYFLALFNIVHGNKYDYSDMPAIPGVRNKIVITCRLHGPFAQSVSSHRNGNGCPRCAYELHKDRFRLSWAERAAKGTPTLYFIKIFGHGEVFYKVGITYRSIGRRFAAAKELRGYSYEVLATHKSENALAIFDWEQSIIETFARLRYWPKRRFRGESECFSSCEEILAIFPL